MDTLPSPTSISLDDDWATIDNASNHRLIREARWANHRGTTVTNRDRASWAALAILSFPVRSIPASYDAKTTEAAFRQTAFDLAVYLCHLITTEGGVNADDVQGFLNAVKGDFDYDIKTEKATAEENFEMLTQATEDNDDSPYAYSEVPNDNDGAESYDDVIAGAPDIRDRLSANCNICGLPGCDCYSCADQPNLSDGAIQQ